MDDRGTDTAVSPRGPAPIEFVGYSASESAEQTVTDISELDELRRKWPISWVRVRDASAKDTVQAVADYFDLHPLVHEDILDLQHHAKFEDFDTYYFLVVRAAIWDKGVARTRQVSLVLGEGYVVTFEEVPTTALDGIRERIRKKHRQLMDHRGDYLMYVIVDVLIDTYFPILDTLTERMDELERNVIAEPGRQTLSRVHALKRDLLTLRRAVSPLREVVNALIRDTDARVEEATRLHLRDCYDHTFQIADLLTTNREIAAGLIEIYLSTLSNRTNETMRVLTVIATIFIPLTFITGLYGMNFDYETSPWNMPELEWYWGYPILWLLMLGIAAFELLMFWRMGWLSGADSDESVRDEADEPEEPPK